MARAVIVLLIASGFLYSQAISQTSSHSDRNSDHCCPVCHIGHSLLLQPAPCITLRPPAPVVIWNHGPEAKLSVRGPLLVASCSRAPPA